MMLKNILLIAFSLISGLSNAQTFRLGLITGVNVSKLSGNDNPNYNFIGFKGGGRVGLDLRRQLRLSMDLLYSRKGHTVSHSITHTSNYKNVRLDYMDIPVKITIMDWMDEINEEDYWKLHFVSGMMFSRLVNFKASNNLNLDITNDQIFNKINWSILTGLVYYPSEHIGLNLQYTHSFSTIEQSKSLPNMKIRNWSFNLIYMFDNKIRKHLEWTKELKD